jgi:TrmH family RNA methyltransferase
MVQSRQNRRIKELRASFSRGSRNETGQVGIEGEHLLIEAIRSGIGIATVFFRTGSEEMLDRLGLPPDIEVLEMPAEVFASAVTTESPQGIAALVVPRAFSLADILRAESPLIVVAAAMQDPGNLGTLIRSAEAFGATGIIILPGTVSPWNPKALRASSGSAFRMPVVAANEAEIFSHLRQSGIQIVAAVAGEAQNVAAIDLTGPTAILIGNEGRGLSAATIASANFRATIPCPGPVESLNAAIAASIMLYEAARQRRELPNSIQPAVD